MKGWGVMVFWVIHRVVAPECKAGGCSAKAVTAIELGPGLWMCGNTREHGTWESVWSTCNECNNYLLPTVETLSLRLQQKNVAATWVSSDKWLAGVTAAKRGGFGFVVTGQPAGWADGGGWYSVDKIQSNPKDGGLKLARLSFANAATHASWIAMTDSTHRTTNTRADKGHPDYAPPSAETADNGQFWMAMCADLSGQASPVDGKTMSVGGPYTGTYPWNNMWRRTPCIAGLTIAHSDVKCFGYYHPTNASVCSYACANGFHVYGSRTIEGGVDKHKHQCVVDSSGSNGVFKGGKCVPDTCTGSRLAHSPTNCTGIPLELCEYKCDEGYHKEGTHRCNLDGIFVGGACKPNTCKTATLVNSKSICIGKTGDACKYECDKTYDPFGVLRCQPNGRFEGGECSAPRGCDDVKWSAMKTDMCGVCGGDNSTCASCDGAPYGAPRWDACGVCGGQYSPKVSIAGHDGKTVMTVSTSQDLHHDASNPVQNCRVRCLSYDIRPVF